MPECPPSSQNVFLSLRIYKVLLHMSSKKYIKTIYPCLNSVACMLTLWIISYNNNVNEGVSTSSHIMHVFDHLPFPSQT